MWKCVGLFESFYKGSFLGSKQLGHEVDHSFPCCVEVRNDWNCTHTPPVCLHGVERNIFNFLTLDILNYVPLSGKYYNTI